MIGVDGPIGDPSYRGSRMSVSDGDGSVKVVIACNVRVLVIAAPAFLR